MSTLGSDPETELGGGSRRFPSTCWSRLIGGLPGDGEARRAALEELARAYWKPVYAYLRTRWAKSNEDAKDLTQDFFLWMMESDLPSRADPARGRFRALVKVALQNYVGMEAQKRGRLKRGGAFSIGAVDEASLPDPRGRAPEEALDDEWRSELVLRAQRMLEEALRREGRETAYAIFRDYYLSGAEDPVYREVAAMHGIAESEVLNHLKHARRRFRDQVAALVAETVDGERELVDEVKSLFGEAAP